MTAVNLRAYQVPGNLSCIGSEVCGRSLLGLCV